MATFGDLVPGPKLKKESPDDSGTSQDAVPAGPLDLDSGVVYLSPRRTPPPPEADSPE